jgi:hypothetical protein
MIIKVAMNFPADSALPRDQISIHPHFFGTDAQALLDALKTNLLAWGPVASAPFTLKAYDAQKPVPSYPIAVATQTGTAPTSSHPRETALCLSYFSVYNRPRYRGRLYLPSTWLTATPPVRPTTASMNNVLAFATSVLTKQLPASHNWVVYSKRNNASYGVTDIWCDDEWDTVRSRGLRSTTRVTGKV